MDTWLGKWQELVVTPDKLTVWNSPFMNYCLLGASSSVVVDLFSFVGVFFFYLDAFQRKTTDSSADCHRES